MNEPRRPSPRSTTALAALAALALALAAPSTARATDGDPWQSFNRGVFRFNDGVDRWFLEPVATGYDFVVPDLAQTWIDNFFTNLRFPIVFANCILQAKPRQAAESAARFMVNTSLGLGGFGDPATKLDVPAPNEDFGQTLGHWGVGSGPYLVLPLMGPSTVRDALAGGADNAARVWPWLVPWEVSTGLGVLDTVNTRSLFLDTVKDLRADSVDFYAAVRDAWLQRRESLVEDRVGEEAKDAAPAATDDLYFPDENGE